MDELQISGKRFISSRRIARDHGYTSDYVGQLIRGGKIIGQKVGRAWYVEEKSFTDYLGADRITNSITPVVKEIVQNDSVTPALSTIAPTAPIIETPAIQPSVENVIEKEVTEIAPLQKSIEIASAPITPGSKEVVSHIPLRILKPDTHSESAKDVGGLRYYADDLPTLPPIRTSHNETRLASTLPQKTTEFKDVSFSTRTQFPSRIFLGGLATFGVSFFLIVSFVSTAISLDLSFGKEGVAAVSYSLKW